MNDVRVTGFTVTGFPGVGIVFAGTNQARADHKVAANNSDYGITAFNSTHGRFEENTSSGSGDADFLRWQLAEGRLHSPKQYRFQRFLGNPRAGLGDGQRHGQYTA